MQDLNQPPRRYILIKIILIVQGDNTDDLIGKYFPSSERIYTGICAK